MMRFKIQGVCIPALGFGTWRLRDQACIDSVTMALETGYRHIDTAQAYENEAEIGKALAKSQIPRHDIFLTTKIDRPNLAAKDMTASLQESLRKLQTDYVDLLLIHWPIETIPFSEQMTALEAIQKKGQARLIGVSNFTVPQLREVTENLGVKIACNQVEYHPYLSQKPVLDFMQPKDMFLTAYAPLARGKVAESALLNEIAGRHHKTPGQVTLRWLIQQKNIAAIPKAGSEKHIQENFNISDFTLSDEEMKSIHALARADGRMISPDWAPVWDKPHAA